MEMLIVSLLIRAGKKNILIGSPRKVKEKEEGLTGENDGIE